MGASVAGDLAISSRQCSSTTVELRAENNLKSVQYAEISCRMLLYDAGNRGVQLLQRLELKSERHGMVPTVVHFASVDHGPRQKAGETLS